MLILACLLASGSPPARAAAGNWAPIGLEREGRPTGSASGPLAVDPRDLSRVFAGSSGEGVVQLQEVETGPCTEDAHTLCLNKRRFEVRVEWQDFQGGSGLGRAIPWSEDSGMFWFFHPENVELTVKVIDGRKLNDHFWVFYGALSNVAYTITVTDTSTGAQKSYINPARRFASAGDTLAFPDGRRCGGIAGLPCEAGEICDLPPGTCATADLFGTCRVFPQACTAEVDPVCGCDGVTYGNDCERLRVGVAKDHDGACG